VPARPARTTGATTAESPAVSVDLIPAELDLNIYSGDTLTMRFTFTDMNGVAVDMTGTWTAQVRASANLIDDEPLAEFVIDATGAAQGIIVLTLPSEQTQTLPPTAVWDIQQMISPDIVRTTHHGVVTVVEDVTRP
jgi:hypothetical protein